MFKCGSIDDELMNSMEKELVSNQLESQHGFNKLAKAVDHLNTAASIFDKAGMTTIAFDITELLKSLFQKDSPKNDESNWEDQLTGGVADEYTPKDFCPRMLEQGKEIEMEHTNDPHKAKEIAMDHMVETKTSDDPIKSDYYEELAKLEEKLEN